MDDKYNDIEQLQPDYDDFMDDGFDDELDDFDGDYSDGVEGEYTSGADAYHNYKDAKAQEEELQERVDKSKEELDKDTMEIPPEQKTDEDGNPIEDNTNGSGESSTQNDNNNDTKTSDTSSENNESDGSGANKSSDSNEDSKEKDVPPEGTQSGKTPASDLPDHKNDDGMRGVVPNQDPGNGGSLPNKDNEQPKKEENKPKEGEDNKSEKNEKSSDSNKENKDKNGREVLAVKEDGTQVVKKNAQDHKNDKKELASAKKANFTNKLNKAQAVADMASDPVGAAKELAKEKIKEEVGKKVAQVATKALTAALPYLLPAIGIIALFFAIIVIVSAVVIIICGDDAQAGAFEYYESPCQRITVQGVGTYSLDDYAAGVVSAEVGEFSNSDATLYAFAIAARTYVLASAASNNCVVPNSASFQAFSSTPSEAAIRASQATAGLILVNSNGNLVSTEYDAFAIKRTDSSSYVLKQKDQHIPKEWVESHISSSRLDYYRNHNHGRGMSQWGAYYLATAQNYSYADILLYYYSNYQIRSTSMFGGYSGESGQILAGMTLSNYLNSRGTSIEMFNSRISTAVNNAGYGTRAGVVAAATTLIGEASNLGITLPYVWGGGHGAISNGANPNWGNNNGLDCSGFVSWAIYNGGFRFSAQSSGNFAQFGNVVSLSSVQAVLQPGDLLWRPQNGSATGHIVLVISVDNQNKRYVCAEANSSSTGIIFKERSFAETNYRGIKMDRYYIDANKR